MCLITVGYSDSQKNYSGMQIPKPKFGDKLPNGAMVIEYTHIDDGSEGWYPNGIVLARIGRGNGEFVTWSGAYDIHQEKWFMNWGHYFYNIIDAVEDYKRRIVR